MYVETKGVMIPLICGSGSGARITSQTAGIEITQIQIQGWSKSIPRSGSNSGSGSTSNEKLGTIKLIFLELTLISYKICQLYDSSGWPTYLSINLDTDSDRNPEVDPDPMWIWIFQSLEPELESESQNGPQSGYGSESKAGIVTPLVQPITSYSVPCCQN